MARSGSWPSYDELPVVEALGLPHAWDVLDHTMGSLGRVDAELQRTALAEAVLGESLGLNLGLHEIEPPLFGRARMTHRVEPHGRNTFEDVLDDFNPQASSQWDGLLHVRAREHGFFGGRTELDAEAPGVSSWAAEGMLARGVLLDVPRWLAAVGQTWDPLAGQEVTAEQLRACAAYQGVELRAGDVLCVRLGWVTAYRALDAAGRADPDLSTRFSGIRADAETARLVWDTGLAALAADNPAVEPGPGDPAAGSLHRRLIPLLGTVLAELLDLDPLAARCAELGRWSFLFVAVPLPLWGGVSSPSNALAVL